jgi:hypothetical protein
MLGRWLFVRIRAAERALQEGRIDEAYAAVMQPDVREHRRGQKLLDDLVRPLLARARLHVQAGRPAEACHDLDRLKAAGRATPEVNELRQRAGEQLDAQRQENGQRRAASAQAEAKLAAGRLESGRLAIERVEDTRRRDELRARLDIRGKRSAQVLAQVRAALQRGDPLAAARHWQESVEQHGRTQETDELAAEVATACRKELDDCFARGRLEPLLATQPVVAALRALSPTLEEFGQVAALCARGAAQLGARDYAGLRETALRLRAARGDAAWIDDVLAALDKLAEARDALLASPLGLFATAAGPAGPAAPGPASPALGPSFEPDPAAAALGPRPLLVLVDGAGSNLLVPQECVRIGRAGGSRVVEVPIPADLQSHHADIERDGSDYFLTAHGPVQINQRDVHRTLLRSGDRLVLGRSARLTFHKPSVKSDTAVLELSHRARLPQDVCGVVLFCDTCLVGPQSVCHIRTREGQSQVVLFERGGRLYGREATARGGKLGDAKPLRLGETFDFGDVRVTVKSYEATGASNLA